MIPKSLALSFLLFSQERSPPVHLIYSCPSFRFQLSHHSLREALNLQLLLTWSVSPLHSFSVPRNFSICSYYSFNYTCIYLILCLLLGASLVAQMVKDQPAVQETWVRSLGWEDPLEEVMANHSNILAWRIPTDRGAWRAIVHGVTKSWTRLSDKAQLSTSLKDTW